MTRFRLIPALGTRGTRTVHGSPLEALTVAEEMSRDRGCEVVVVEAPEGGLTRRVGTVGERPKKKGANDA